MADENGVDVTGFRLADSYGKNVSFYSAFNPTSTSFIYNEAGGQAIADGEINLGNIHTKRNIQILILTLGSASITVQIEGRNRNATTWGLIYSKTFTAPTTIDKIINLQEYTDKLRVGVKVATPGTDSITITGDFITKRN